MGDLIYNTVTVTERYHQQGKLLLLIIHNNERKKIVYLLLGEISAQHRALVKLKIVVDLKKIFRMILTVIGTLGMVIEAQL